MFAFVCEEDELGAADANGVAVVHGLAAYGGSIDEGTVLAVKIDEFMECFCLSDGAVPPRDHRIDQAQLICIVSADGDLAVDELSNSTCQRTFDGQEPRAASGPPMRQSVAESVRGGIFRGGWNLSDTRGYPFGYR